MTSGQPPREQSDPSEKPVRDAAADSPVSGEPAASGRAPSSRNPARAHASESAAAASAAAAAAVAAVSAAIAATAASSVAGRGKAARSDVAAMAERPPKAVQRPKASASPKPRKPKAQPAKAEAAKAEAAPAPEPAKAEPAKPRVTRREDLPQPARAKAKPEPAKPSAAEKPLPVIPGITRREELAAAAAVTPLPPDKPPTSGQALPVIPGITRREELSAAKAAEAARLADEEDAAGKPLPAEKPAPAAAKEGGLPPPKFVKRKGAPKQGDDLAEKVSHSPVFVGLAMVLLAVRVAFGKVASVVAWPYRQITGANDLHIEVEGAEQDPRRKRKKKGLVASLADGAVITLVGTITLWVVMAGVVMPIIAPSPTPVMVGDETGNPYATKTPVSSQVAVVSPDASTTAEPGASPTATETAGATATATPGSSPTPGPTPPPGSTPTPTPPATPTPPPTPLPTPTPTPTMFVTLALDTVNTPSPRTVGEYAYFYVSSLPGSTCSITRVGPSSKTDLIPVPIDPDGTIYIAWGHGAGVGTYSITVSCTAPAPDGRSATSNAVIVTWQVATPSPPPAS